MNNFAQNQGGTDNKSNLINIGKGILLSYIITFVLLFVLSILLTYTKLAENTISPIIIVITIISILIGSSIASSKIKKKGIINGGIVGFIYISLLYLLSSIVEVGFSVNIYAIIMITLSILSGMLRRNCRSKLKKIIDKQTLCIIQ